MPTLKDEEADAKLSAILKTESGGRANAGQLAATWSHLWVWQGSSGEDPADHASAHKDSLVQRLQQDGIAAVMQSATDRRVRERIAASYDELFTSTGKPKAGSKPELASAQLAAAEAALQHARDSAARLEQAVAEHARAERDIAAADAVLPSLRQQRATTATKVTQAAELQREEESRLSALNSAAATRDQLAQADTRIHQLHHQATTARQALQPAEEKETTLSSEQLATLATSKTAESAQREAAEAVRQIRLRHDLATAIVTAFEKTDVHRHLATRAAETGTILTELADLRARHSQVPPLTAKHLASLRKLERESSQAAATLAAIATGIEILQSDSNVALDGETLAVGDSRILTDTCELAIGSGSRIRIRPGGGGSLADARIRSQATERAWSDALASHALRDLDHAATVCERRQSLEQQIAGLETRWKALGGETLATELAAAATALAAAEADVRLRAEVLGNDPDFKSPDTLAAARELVSATREKLAAAEATESAARHRAVQTRTRSDQATQALHDHRDQLATARQALRDLETSIKVLEDTHGTAEARHTALARAANSHQQAGDQLAATRHALAALAPDSLSADLERFTRAIDQQETLRREAENRRLVARDRLTLDGSSDPEADLSHALARCQAAREAHASEQRRAKAIEKLHLLFSSSREAIDRSLVQPLADRISGYLQCLFGPGTAARVNLSEAGINGLDLIRPGAPAFGFATLSGGAKEQVAAATRLAMAEILASDHDGCLPILFDDAFAYTDPDRVQALQRMLDLAALRGLQIIVLTCTPADYSSLGASEIRLG
jgi:DNA repair exonuclease SbcCD ATPase subunit